MHAPANGKILADLVLTGRCDLIDPELLSLQRFAEDRLIEETAVLWVRGRRISGDSVKREQVSQRRFFVRADLRAGEGP